MKRRAGMTLIEVLAALVLMGMVAGATLPLLRTAVGTLRAPEPGASAHELELLADALVEDPAAMGLDALPESGEVRVRGLGFDSVRVEVLRPEGAGVEHAWLAVSAGDRTVFRWLPEPPAADGGTSR